MGSSQNSDNRVKLYVELATQVIYAGQYLDGTAYLQVLEDTAYSDLMVSLVGSEEVIWVERSEKLASTLRNSRKTYSEEFLLRGFQGGLKRGHYSLPFSVLLPSTLPATAQFSPRNGISFVLTLSLINQKDKSQTQTYNVPISIRQPLRLTFSLSQYGTTTSECWKCLGSKTSGVFHIQVDRNEVKSGEPFKIRGFIDNTNGQFSIDEFCVLLTRKVTKISEEGKVKVKTKDLCELVKPKTGVKVGLQKKFQAEVTIPKDIKEHTAIGNIISRCYYLTLLGDVGCFYSDTRIEKHIHLNNDIPNIEVQPPTPPNDWNPTVYPQATFLNLKPYLYQPCPELKIFNQKGNAVLPSIYNPTTSQNMIKMGE